MILTNAHIHTPHSFCCFSSVEEAVRKARDEGISILGINDFNTTGGYDEFADQCARHNLYPLFNIEFIALSPEDRRAGIRWNDPKNPGNIYFSGKGLNHPVTFSTDTAGRLKALWKGTQDHAWKVIDLLNTVCAERIGPAIQLDYNTIRKNYARETVRERHIARALADALAAGFPDGAQRLAAVKKLFADPSFSKDIDDTVAFQNELRNRLLKNGMPAYLPEPAEAFFSLNQVTHIILDGGGIPCYPILADDSGPLNEREADVNALVETLTEHNIHAVEFIPARNSLKLLEHYAGTFAAHGFCVVFGTEHNTPACPPFVPTARGGTPFSAELAAIAHRGACIVAAHQEKHRRGEPGFVNDHGDRLVEPRDLDEFAAYGESAVTHSLSAHSSH